MENQFPMDDVIAVGFGHAGLTRDGKEVYQEPQGDDGEDPMTGAQAEAMAAENPHHDWQITLVAPLYDRTYQRQGIRKWVLIEKGPGFA
jgi:hypothetical protein